MKRTFINTLMMVFAIAAFGWGQKGHDVTAYIAEQHLTPATAAAVAEILEGKSPVYWANWLDNASHTPAYATTKTWHYKNVDKGVRYEEAPANPAGDVTTAIKAQIETLSNPASTAAERNLAMKILVHVVGDLHQPMHMGHATDLGGNRVRLKYFGRDNNLHSIWDTNLVESAHKWSYTEWQQQLDRLTPEQQAAVIAGSVDDWAKECVTIADRVYTAMPEGSSISYNEVATWAPVIEQQLLNGGLRLAHILNSIYDPQYAANK